MDPLNPKLTNGWKDIENTYTDQLVDSYVQLRYVGGSRFQITCFVGRCEPYNKESFLLGVVTHPRTALYAVKLTKSQAQASHLVVSIPELRICCFQNCDCNLDVTSSDPVYTCVIGMFAGPQCSFW